MSASEKPAGASSPGPASSPAAEPPIETEGLAVSAPKSVAGGLPAIASTLRHALREMGASRSAHTLSEVNQKGGFDCPSCAWPDPDGERSRFEFCENGARAVADEATRARITEEFFWTHSVASLAGQSDLWLGSQGRLTRPMVLEEGRSHYEPIGWREAFDLVARELGSLASPNEAVFYTSGRTSNEAAFLYQLFARQFGTNNLPDCSNMCHESSGAALQPVLGMGKGTVTLDDFLQARAIFILGQNPGSNHPRMLTALQQSKRAGATIVAVNPLREAGLLRFRHPQHVVETLVGPGTALADLYLQVRIGGDMALLKGIMKEMLAAEDERPGSVVDRAFVEAKTAGFPEFRAALDRVSWDDILRESGVSRAEMQEAARVAARSDRTIVCWAMGLTQHRHAVATIREIVNFLLLRGSIGKPGAGACPVRGHSNVQGDRTMGIWEKPREAFLAALEKEFAFQAPRAHGYDTVSAIRAMRDGAVKVFFALGGNFLSASPDTEAVATALRRCALTVHVSTKLHRAHLVTGRRALILPCLGRTERDVQESGEQLVSTENSMGIVQSSRGGLEPASPELRSEPWIAAELAHAVLGSRSGVAWRELAADYDRIRDHIARVVPGFEDYNRRLREPGGFALPNGPRSGAFPTDDGKAHFTAQPLPVSSLAPGELVLMTIRSHDQFNTTIYGLDDRYRGIGHGRRVLFLNAADMEAGRIGDGDFVDVTSHFRGQRRTWRKVRAVPYDIPRGNAAAYFPEANVLVPLDSVADTSNTPTSKWVAVTLEPHRSLA